jgi:hypothetical protein
MTGIVLVASGILLQLTMLLGRPLYRFAQTEKRGFRAFLSVMIVIRLSWAVFAYWSIWCEVSHPEQWPLDLPGSALIGYAAVFPVLILAFDWLLLLLLGFLSKPFNSKFDADEHARRSM